MRRVIRELSSLFTGGKISKINQPEKERLSLLIYTRKGTLKLDICLSAKFCRISAGEREESANPKVAPNFCMLLRKHLQNAEITAIEQVDFERVVYFDFNCFSEFETAKERLYLEIMGKYSNAVLTRDGVILGALKTSSLESCKRVTLTGARYTLPEKQDKANPLKYEELEEVFKEEYSDPADFIAKRVEGIATSTAADMAQVYNGKPTAKNVFDYVNDGTYSPCVIFSDGKMKDFCVRSGDKGAKSYPTLLEAQAAYYDFVTKEKSFEDEKRKLKGALSSVIKKTEKRLGQIESGLQDCETAEDVKLKGELLTANLYAVERGASFFEAVNYYDDKGGKIKIALDKQLTPAQNAQKYYKKYAKLKRTAESLTEQKTELLKKKDYLKSIDENLNSSEDMRDLIDAREELVSLSLLPKPVGEGGKNKRRETPFRTFLYMGFTVLAGRNNAQNDRLLKTLKGDDLWLHVKGYHSSHVGILSDGKTVPDEVKLFAAEVCAHYSEAREKDKAPVDFTLRKFVKKPPKAPPGFVTYTDFSTLIVAPNAHTEERKKDE